MRFGDKFFFIWFFMVLESYEPTHLQILMFGASAFLFAATWEYFHDLAIFKWPEKKLQSLKENYSVLHGGYTDESRTE